MTRDFARKRQIEKEKRLKKQMQENAEDISQIGSSRSRSPHQAATINMPRKGRTNHSLILEEDDEYGYISQTGSIRSPLQAATSMKPTQATPNTNTSSGNPATLDPQQVDSDPLLAGVLKKFDSSQAFIHADFDQNVLHVSLGSFDLGFLVAITVAVLFVGFVFGTIIAPEMMSEVVGQVVTGLVVASLGVLVCIVLALFTYALRQCLKLGREARV